MLQQKIFITTIAIPISAEDSFLTRIGLKEKSEILLYHSIILTRCSAEEQFEKIGRLSMRSLSTDSTRFFSNTNYKPLNSGNNYRGISLLPIITKILELIILERCPVMTKHINSQFGFTAASSSLHAEVVIRDTLRYYNNNDTPIYMCSLDAEKAFDCCNWFTLFSKLAEKDIPTSIITFLIKLYRNGSAHVNYISLRSATFSLTQDVRQGRILSPYLYNLCTEDLITNIKSMNIGTFLSNKTHTAIIVYHPAQSQLELYGLELTPLTKTQEVNLDTQARSCMKSLFNVSRNSKNLIHSMYNLPDVTAMLNIRKIKLLKQLLTNKSTSPRYYWLLSNNDSSAFLSDATDVLRRNNLDIVDVLTGSNLKKIRSSGNDRSRLDDVDCLKKCVTNWQIYGNRLTFRSILEEFVHRTNTVRN